MGLHRVFLLFLEEGAVAFNYVKAAMTLPSLGTNKCSRDVKGRGCWSIWGKVLDLEVAWPKRAAICPAAGAQQTFTECIYEEALCFPANDTLSLIWRRGHLWKWCRGHLWKTPLRISHLLGPCRENKGAQMTRANRLKHLEGTFGRKAQAGLDSGEMWLPVGLATIIFFLPFKN